MLTKGDILQNRYRIDGLLGQGGMGAVYRAWDLRLSIPLAVKEMSAQPGLDTDTLDDLRSQFQQEATVLARLNHPNLVGVTDYFQEGRNVYLVMKFVAGESLAELIRREGAVPEAQVRTWAAQLLDALAYCHRQGVIHRDIKPQNIIVEPDGDAILVDFGLVKLWDPDDPGTRTVVRGIGTPQYAPPEQYEVAAGHTEPSSDLYSLGATMYHALTGQAPPTATMRVVEPEAFRPISTLAPQVSQRTIDAIEGAMGLARTQRWSTAVEMAGELGVDTRESRTEALGSRTEVMSAGGLTEHMGGVFPSSAKQAPVGDTSGKRKGRVPIWIALAGVVVLGLLAVGTVAALEVTGVVNLGLASRFRPAATLDPANKPTKNAPSLTDTPEVTETALPTETPAPTETPQPSVTPTPTVRATQRPRPTSTRIDIALPTETPTPTPSATTESTGTPAATDTPSPTATTGPTATATASPEPSSGPTGALVDFETFGTWRRGDQPHGDLTQTSTQVKAGSYAAQLDYNFPASDDDFVVFSQSRSLGGTPNSFAIWVYGDGSRHFLNLWVQDAQGEIWSVGMGRVGGAGWQQLTGQLAPGLKWPSGRISGPDNGKVDYPVSFNAVVLDRPGAGPQSGRIYLDEITAWTGTVVAPTAQPASEASPPPTDEATEPAEGVGQILFTVQSSDGTFLYSTDPSWSQMTEVGRADYNSATCVAPGGTVSTLAGQSFNVVTGGTRCNLTERTDACTSPDSNYQLITNFMEGWIYAVLLKNTQDGSETFIYQGKLNTSAGVQWDSGSRYVAFGIGSGIHVVSASSGQFWQAFGGYDEGWTPTFTPDGNSFLYLKPSGGQGNSDVFIVSAEGGAERNLTNAPATPKLCPRWRR